MRRNITKWKQIMKKNQLACSMANCSFPSGVHEHTYIYSIRYSSNKVHANFLSLWVRPNRKSRFVAWGIRILKEHFHCPSKNLSKLDEFWLSLSVVAKVWRISKELNKGIFMCSTPFFLVTSMEEYFIQIDWNEIENIMHQINFQVVNRVGIFTHTHTSYTFILITFKMFPMNDNTKLLVYGMVEMASL